MADLNLTFTGPVTITSIDTAAVTAAILQRIDALEATMTAPLTTVAELLAALQIEVDQLSADEAADRAAFDALAAVVRAFIASVTAGGSLTAEQAAQGQAILDSIAASDAVDVAQAADEAALQGEVPA